MKMLEDLGFQEITECRCGVYVLVYNGRVLYVGKSTKAFARLGVHVNNMSKVRLGKAEHGEVRVGKIFILFNQIFFYPCPASRLDLMEIEMIVKLKPKFNTQHVGVEKPDNIIPLSQLLAKPREEFVRRI